MRYHYILVRMIVTKKCTNSKCQRGYGEKGKLALCWECKLEQSLWKAVWQFLKILKIELPYDPAFPLLSIYQKKLKLQFEKMHAPQHLLPHCLQSSQHENSSSAHPQMISLRRRDIYKLRNIDIAQPQERMEYCHLQQHGWILQNIMFSEANQRKTDII